MNIVLTFKKNVKMKKTLHFWLMALLIGGISMAVTSCKDDDKNNGNGNGEFVGPEAGPTDTEEAHMAARWLIALTDMDGFTDDWASKTYEPTIGEPSQTQATTRVVCVADLDYAKMNFSAITDIDESKLSTTQTQTIDGVGSLTWTPSAEGASNLAVVDVNTKLIPHLSRIVYCTKEQMGDNGGYKGTAYYRFGDVIEDNQGYYWVCVKPAFGSGSGSQNESYWINVFNRDPTNGKGSNGRVPLIPDNLIQKKYDNEYSGNTILFPYGTACDLDQVHLLSNLVWALLDPEAYHKTVGNGTKAIGLGGYEYQYNGEKFLKRVAQQWKENHIWEKLFNRTYEQMKQFKKLNYYYYGYSWKYGMGSRCQAWLHSTQKFSKDKGSWSGDEVRYECYEPGSGFDIRRYCSDPDQNPKTASNGTGQNGYAPATQFTSSAGYWYVRCLPSAKLQKTSSHASVYVNIKNMAEIYRYNASYKIIAGDNNPVENENDIASEVAPEDIAVGNILGRNGKFYTNAKYARQFGTEPIAIVAYTTGNSTSKFVEESKDFKDKQYNCLLMSLTRKTNKVKWSQTLYSDSCQVDILSNYTNEPTALVGLANTTNLCDFCGKKHNHPAAEQCEKNSLPDDATNFSSWFLPSVGQFKLAVMGLGGFTWSTSNGFGSESQATSKMEEIRKKFANAGVESYYADILDGNKHFWTTTLLDKKDNGKRNKACTFFFKYFLKSGEDLSTFAETVTDEQYVLPFLPFKYTPKE